MLFMSILGSVSVISLYWKTGCNLVLFGSARCNLFPKFKACAEKNSFATEDAMATDRTANQNLDVIDFPQSQDWVFAKDIYVTEDGEKLSYDQMEHRDEGETHRWLKEVTRDSLSEIGYLVYDAGVGLSDHNSFCDGAAMRNEQFMLYECLLSWAITDYDQLARKVAFAKRNNLLLVTPSRRKRLLKLFLKKHAVETGFKLITAYPVKHDGIWRLAFASSGGSLVEADPGKLVCEIRISQKQVWAEILISMQSDLKSTSIFFTSVQKAILGYFGKVGAAANQRSNTPSGTFEFIIRDNGREVARSRRSVGTFRTNTAWANYKVRASDLDRIIARVKERAESHEIRLEWLS